MKRTMALALALAAAAITLGSVTMAGGQETQPGLPTIARMYILNRGAAEAVPVSIQSVTTPIPVTAAGPLTLADNTTVSARRVRQTWEYRQIRLSASLDQESVLNAAGAEGWEAVSVTTAAGTASVLFKRPR